MSSPATRLLRLLTRLQSRRDWSGPSLAEALGVDVRTVRRDIDRLREMGYRIDASAGQGGGYRLGAGAQLPPVLFSDSEAVALMLALHAAAGSVAGLDNHLAGLMGKLDTLLPVRLQPQIRALAGVARAVPLPGVLVEIELLALLAGACRDRLRLRLRYRDRQARESQRELEPVQLVTIGRRWYLVAWDCKRQDWRSFRADRISEPTIDGSRFPLRRLPGDAAEFVSKAIASMPMRYRLGVRLHGDYHELVATVPAWCGRLRRIDQTRSMLEVSDDSIEGIAAQLTLVNRPFELVEPAPAWYPELLACVERLVQTVGAAARMSKVARTESSR